MFVCGFQLKTIGDLPNSEKDMLILLQLLLKTKLFSLKKSQLIDLRCPHCAHDATLQ